VGRDQVENTAQTSCVDRVLIQRGPVVRLVGDDDVARLAEQLPQIFQRILSGGRGEFIGRSQSRSGARAAGRRGHHGHQQRALQQAHAKAGQIEQNNLDDYAVARTDITPDIRVYLVESDAPPSGVGEPGVPPTAPAICNAIYAAIGKRIRSLPIDPDQLKAG